MQHRATTEKFGEAGQVHHDTDARMSDERTRRVGENEALCRQLNERIRGLNDAFAR